MFDNSFRTFKQCTKVYHVRITVVVADQLINVRFTASCFIGEGVLVNCNRQLIAVVLNSEETSLMLFLKLIKL